MPIDYWPTGCRAEIRKIEDERAGLDKQLIQINGYLVIYPKDESYLRRKQEIEDMKDALTKRIGEILLAYNQGILARVSK